MRINELRSNDQDQQRKIHLPRIQPIPRPGLKPLIEGFNLILHDDDRCFLVRSNGASKTMILTILGGKHMVDPHMVHALGQSTFHKTTLIASGNLSYLGGEWQRDVAFAGFDA